MKLLSVATPPWNNAGVATEGHPYDDFKNLIRVDGKTSAETGPDRLG